MSEFKSKILIERILNIVKSLYIYKEVKVSLLSKKYNVCERTIRRNLQTIQATIPLINKRGVYSLDMKKLQYSQNTLQMNLLSAFASNADIVVDCFQKAKSNQEKITFAMEYNHLPKKVGEVLMFAIDKGCKAEFIYKKPEGSSRRVINPIKFYTEKERWYLIAKDDKDSKVKIFYFGKIFEVKALENVPIALSQKDIDEANNKLSVWSDSSKKKELVKLYVKPKVAEFILDSKLHKSQEIADEHCDGGLEVHCYVTHKLEIFPKIMSYFPYIHIIEPQWLRDELKQDLEIYQREMREMDI